MKFSPTKSKSRRGRFGNASNQYIDWLGHGLRVIPREDHQNHFAHSRVVGSRVSKMLNESAHYHANHRVNAKNPLGDIKREGQTETALAECLPDHVLEGREFVAFQYAEVLTFRLGAIGECRARLPRATGRDDGEFPVISRIICYLGYETECPTDAAGSKRHAAAPWHGKGPAWSSIGPKGDPRQSDGANAASPPGRRRYVRAFPP